MLLEAETAEVLGHLAIRFLANQLIFRLTTPKINAADLKNLPRGMAEQMDQGCSVAALISLCGDS
jgi:hypothetical protein